MPNVLILTGTRPEIIKMAPVYQALQKIPDHQTTWCHTGQHDRMADQAFCFFDITPDITLPRPSGSRLHDLLAGLLHNIDQELSRQPFDIVCVHGDTLSTLAGGLAAFYRRIPVAHIEAGLRTYDLDQPFPEESNRRLVATITARHYAPTARARENLLREGVPDSAIVVTGNTIVDAQQTLCQRFQITRQNASPPRLLVTAHRRENWESMGYICTAIRSLLAQHPTLQVIFPVHLNPIVRDQIWQGIGAENRVSLVEPMDYLALQRELSRAALVLTDSGGIQEEAAGFGVPCLVMRETTERPEALEAGIAALVGTQAERITSIALPLLREEITWESSTGNPFGDGQAAQRISQDLQQFLHNQA